jgi:hypothetical protein
MAAPDLVDWGGSGGGSSHGRRSGADDSDGAWPESKRERREAVAAAEWGSKLAGGEGEFSVHQLLPREWRAHSVRRRKQQKFSAMWPFFRSHQEVFQFG